MARTHQVNRGFGALPTCGLVGLLVLGAFGLDARAASIEEDLEGIGRSTAQLVDKADSLDHQIAPGRAHLSRSDAVQEFEDNLYLLMLGKNRAAAEGFFGLVTTGALQDPVLHRDAEWHLAEALYAMGNVVTAEARFRVIAEDDNHPFRDDAVRRMLELYAETNNAKRFYEVYESEIVQGRVKPTPLITYTVARSFYKQDDFPKARQYFEDVAIDTTHYSRARYFLGVMALREDRMADAERFFGEASQASVDGEAQRKTLDLSLLALARLAYERGDYPTATDYYQQVSGDSIYLADVLYETVWTLVKQDKYAESLQAVELFLLAFPEHQYSGELRVVQGHLHMGCGQTPERCKGLTFEDPGQGDSYDRALASYEDIVLEYTPIRDRFSDLANSDDEPKLYFEEVLALENDDSAEGIPTFALAMMRDDVQLANALDAYANLERQRSEIEECETLINELELVLAGSNALGGYEAARYAARVSQTRAVQEQVALIGLEVEWLNDQGANTSRFSSDVAELGEMSAGAGQRIEAAGAAKEAFEAKVSGLRQEIADVEAEVDSAESQLETLQRTLSEQGDLSESERAGIAAESADVEAQLGQDRVRLGELRVELSNMQAPDSEERPDDGPGEQLSAKIAEVREGLEALRPAGDSVIPRRFDELHAQLEYAQKRFADIQGRLGSLATTEFGRVKERFRTEVAEVAAERQSLETLTIDADRVAVALTREGFERMESFFAESVLKADTGIVDVYWARKLELADERERVQQERNDLVAELNRRFELIRQKMEQ